MIERVFTIVVLAFAAACSGGSAQPDAGIDGSGSCMDSDADGICDNVDVCPFVADPMQRDLDQDGIGTACDPVESVSFDAQYAGTATGSVSMTQAAAVVSNACVVPTCKYMVFAASGTDSMLAASDSGASADAWAKGDWLSGPVVTRDGQILLGRRTGTTGDVVALDPATQQAVVRSTLAMIVDVLRSGTGAPVLLSLGFAPSSAGQLFEPRGGTQLASVSSAVENWFTTDSTDFLDGLATESAPFVSRLASGPSTYTLQRYTPGAAALTDLTPAQFLATSVRRMETGHGARWCASINDEVGYYEPTAMGTRYVALPDFQSCSALQARKFPGLTVFVGAGYDYTNDNTRGIAADYERAGVVHTIAADQAGYTRVRTFVNDTLVVSFDPGDPLQPSKLWVVWPDDVIQPLSTDLAAVDVSVTATTVHLIGVQSGGTASGPLLVRRIKRGFITDEKQLLASTSTSSDNRIITTVEGGAVASSNTSTWIAPSSYPQTFTAVGDPALKLVRGGARGAHTVVLAGVPPDNVISAGTGSVFAYDEVNGAARITALDTGGTGFDAMLLDLPTETSPWFVYGNSTSCTIGRIQSGGAQPVLDPIPCGQGVRNTKVVGRSRRGEWVVSHGDLNASTLYGLGSTSVRTIAGGGPLTPILDRTDAQPVLVGWVAADSTRTLVCIDDQPLRCWRAPANAKVLDARIEYSGPNSAPAIAVLLFDTTSAASRFTVVRSNGPGNAQP